MSYDSRYSPPKMTSVNTEKLTNPDKDKYDKDNYDKDDPEYIYEMSYDSRYSPPRMARKI